MYNVCLSMHDRPVPGDEEAGSEREPCTACGPEVYLRVPAAMSAWACRAVETRERSSAAPCSLALAASAAPNLQPAPGSPLPYEILVPAGGRAPRSMADTYSLSRCSCPSWLLIPVPRCRPTSPSHSHFPIHTDPSPCSYPAFALSLSDLIPISASPPTPVRKPATSVKSSDCVLTISSTSPRRPPRSRRSTRRPRSSWTTSRQTSRATRTRWSPRLSSAC